MRNVLRWALLSLLIVACPAWAQSPWPQKPVRIVVPFPGGGSADALCRIVGEKLSEAWKQPVIVDDMIAIRSIMHLVLTYDHRLVDGRQAVTFLVKVKQAIEDPTRILLSV